MVARASFLRRHFEHEILCKLLESALHDEMGGCERSNKAHLLGRLQRQHLPELALNVDAAVSTQQPPSPTYPHPPNSTSILQPPLATYYRITRQLATYFLICSLIACLIDQSTSVWNVNLDKGVNSTEAAIFTQDPFGRKLCPAVLKLGPARQGGANASSLPPEKLAQNIHERVYWQSVVHK